MPSTISATKDLSIEAKYWRNLYLTLKQENNEEYQDVESLLQLTIDREAQLMTYARLLERKVDSIIAPVGDDSESIELSRKLELQRKLLRFYETMGSITIDRKEAKEGESSIDDSLYTCTLKNRLHRVSASFSLRRQETLSKGRASHEEAEICNFVPLVNQDIMPAYLQSAIDCEPSMAPVILTDVMQALYC
jgi:hypothetical protein